MNNIINIYQTNVNIIGNHHILPVSFQESIVTVKEKTMRNNYTFLNLCVAYNPLEEILDAVNKSYLKGEIFIKNLWIQEPLDLVIRTGGANLLSIFLPIQAGYARLYFLEKLFNDVGKVEIVEILEKFGKINRLYGD